MGESNFDEQYVEKSVQLVRGSSFRKDLLQNIYFKDEQVQLFKFTTPSSASSGHHQDPSLARPPTPQTPGSDAPPPRRPPPPSSGLGAPCPTGASSSGHQRLPKPQTLGSGNLSNDEQVQLFKFTTPSSSSSGHHQDPPLVSLPPSQTPGSDAPPPRRPPPPSLGPRTPCPPSTSGGPLPPPAVALTPAKLLTPKTSGLGATRRPPPPGSSASGLSAPKAYNKTFSFPPPKPATPIPSAPPLPRSETIFLPVQERLILRGRRRAVGGSGRLPPHPPTASPPPPPLPTTPGSVAAALMRQPVSKKEKPKLAPKPNLTQILVKADQSTGKLTFQNFT